MDDENSATNLANSQTDTTTEDWWERARFGDLEDREKRDYLLPALLGRENARHETSVCQW